jgi:hypothetical protein
VSEARLAFLFLILKHIGQVIFWWDIMAGFNPRQIQVRVKKKIHDPQSGKLCARVTIRNTSPLTIPITQLVSYYITNPWSTGTRVGSHVNAFEHLRPGEERSVVIPNTPVAEDMDSANRWLLSTSSPTKFDIDCAHLSGILMNGERFRYHISRDEAFMIRLAPIVQGVREIFSFGAGTNPPAPY